MFGATGSFLIFMYLELLKMQSADFIYEFIVKQTAQKVQ